MDLVLMGANVLTMDALNRRAEAVAVQGGRIAAVGANVEIAKQVGPETAVLHLAGRTLVPGFIDPHNHFSLTAFEPVSVDCRVPPHRSISSILDAIAATAKDTPRGRWIRGWGFNARLVRENRRITRGELDEVAPHNPVCLLDYSYHACYANSAALALAGVDRHTPDPPHGQILRDAAGEPDGACWERAMDLIHAVSLTAYLEYYRETVAELIYHNGLRHLAYGVTSVGDALVTPEVEEVYRVAESRKLLPLTVHQMLGGEKFYAPPEKVVTGASGDGNVSDRLRGGTVKLFMDPVYPGFALIRYDACGHEERLGDCCYTQDEIDRLVMQAHQRGLQVAIHCCGTWAVAQALNAFERALRARPRDAARFRMEHCVLPTISQIKRARALGVVAVVQPSFIHRSGDRFEARAKEMGGDVRALPFKTMLGEGMIVAASSDSPGCPVDPMMGLYAMVTRRTQSGGPPAGADEAVTPLEGLRMYSIDAAYAMGRDGEVGSLEPGKRADMVVLSHDPTAVDPAFLRDIVTERTYVEGQLLYQR
jgi:predicted amidohydrolase YtcJ